MNVTVICKSGSISGPFLNTLLKIPYFANANKVGKRTTLLAPMVTSDALELVIRFLEDSEETFDKRTTKFDNLEESQIYEFCYAANVFGVVDVLKKVALSIEAELFTWSRGIFSKPLSDQSQEIVVLLFRHFSIKSLLSLVGLISSWALSILSAVDECADAVLIKPLCAGVVYTTENCGFSGQVLIKHPSKRVVGFVNPTQEDFEWAYRNGHLKLVQWCFNTFDIDITTDKYQLSHCIYHCIRCGNLDVVRWLTEKLKLTFSDFEAAANGIHTACENGHLDIVKWMVDYFELTDEHVKADNCLAFLDACANGHLPVVMWLAQNFDIKSSDVIGREDYALKKAFLKGHIAVASWLKDHFNLKISKPLRTSLMNNFASAVEDFPNDFRFEVEVSKRD
jgi:hypothetical protein